MRAVIAPTERGAALDILEGNDGEANRLLMNDGFGGFTEDTSSAFAAGARKTNTIFAADLDADGGACHTCLSRWRMPLARALGPACTHTNADNGPDSSSRRLP